MNLEKIFKEIRRNLLIGLYGSIIGIIFSIFYVVKIWLPLNSNDVGLAIIAILPVMLIMFSIGGIIVGGVLGIIIYQLIRLFSANKNIELK